VVNSFSKIRPPFPLLAAVPSPRQPGNLVSSLDLKLCYRLAPMGWKKIEFRMDGLEPGHNSFNHQIRRMISDRNTEHLVIFKRIEQATEKVTYYFPQITYDRFKHFLNRFNVEDCERPDKSGITLDAGVESDWNHLNEG
jgi:hypothetical protein